MYASMISIPPTPVLQDRTQLQFIVQASWTQLLLFVYYSYVHVVMSFVVVLSVSSK